MIEDRGGSCGRNKGLGVISRPDGDKAAAGFVLLCIPRLCVRQGGGMRMLAQHNEAGKQGWKGCLCGLKTHCGMGTEQWPT